MGGEGYDWRFLLIGGAVLVIMYFPVERLALIDASLFDDHGKGLYTTNTCVVSVFIRFKLFCLYN